MNKRIKMMIIGTLVIASLVTGCGNTKSSGTNTQQQTSTSIQNTNKGLSGIVTYDSDDYYTQWSKEQVSTISLEKDSIKYTGEGAVVNGSTITIKSAGTYLVSGTLSDGQIIIEANKEDTVRLILNGTEVNCSKSSPLYVKSAKKVVLSLEKDTTNTFVDGSKYVLEDQSADEPNSAIYSKDDLSINGTGTLVVKGNYNNALTSKDDLKIVEGNINVTSVDDGIMGRDLVAIKEGNINIEAEGDGIKATNDTEENKGVVAIEGGKINIAKSYEGIEGFAIYVAGGETHIKSDDDGINIAGESGMGGKGNKEPVNVENKTTTEAKTETSSETSTQTTDSRKLTISGGYVVVDAKGDGLDANGSIEMTGGTVLVYGPTNNGNGSLDYDRTFNITGGVLVTAGSSGMAQAPTDTSSQYSIMMTYSNSQKANTIVRLEDSDGKEIITLAPTKDFQSVVISSPKLEKGKKYNLYTGGTSSQSAVDGLYKEGSYNKAGDGVTFSISDSITYLCETGVTTNKPVNMQGGGMKPKDEINIENGTKPEGMTTPQEGTNLDGKIPPQDGTKPEGKTPPQDGTKPEKGSKPEDGTKTKKEKKTKNENSTSSGTNTDKSSITSVETSK